MADSNQSSQAKTELPTAHRLRELRRKGQVPQSKDLSATVSVIAACAFFALAGPLWIARCQAMLSDVTSFDFRRLADDTVLVSWIRELLTELIFLSAPPIVLLVVVAALASGLQSGGVFSMHPVKPEMSRLNPVEGFKRLFALQTVVELLKLTAKTAILGLLLWLIAHDWLPELLRSHWLPTAGILPLANTVFAALAWSAVACFLATTMFDLWFQRWNFRRKNKMSLEEVRRERKENEGDPHIRSRRRQMHQEVGLSNMLANVRRANVVVVNPTHIAVALHYVAGETDLPIVVAKGEGHIAAEIRRIAEEERIPIMRNVDLARALHAQAPLNQYIPDDFLEPVAAVLRWARSLQRT
jgi:type III secretion protein U